jgi:hypothetical protein
MRKSVLRDFVQRAPDNAAGHAALSELYLDFKNQPEQALEPARKPADFREWPKTGLC